MKLNVKMENCYGIDSLEHCFNFTQQSSKSKPEDIRRTFIIYARNGEMKTSFADTFQMHSEGEEVEDRIFPERRSKKEISRERQGEKISLEANKIFVIKSYDGKYTSDKISTLLVKPKLEAQYRKTRNALQLKEGELFTALSKCSKIKTEDVKNTLSQDLKNTNHLYKNLENIKLEIERGGESESLATIKYSEIFNPKAIDAIQNDEEMKKYLDDYAKAYEELIEKSKFFQTNFNPYNAEEIKKNLKKHNWFEAKNKILTSDDTKIEKDEDLNSYIKEQKDQFFIELREKCDVAALERRLNKNQDLRNFTDHITKFPHIINEFLREPDSLKRKIWVAYLAKEKDKLDSLMDEYEKCKSEMDKIRETAKNQETAWEGVIKIFNERFDVPFSIKIGNLEDTKLNISTPEIQFLFKDNQSKNHREVTRTKLANEVLSAGEKRALYILNIIFEIEARRRQEQETLFVIDDIADSFDYKNKYAIIEYLKDITKVDYFYQIILTHNFDFYRTVSSRFKLKKDFRLHTYKKNGKLKLEKEKYGENPFNDWKNRLHERKILIASIPFVRNLADYCNLKDKKEKLTSLLHIKEGNATTIDSLKNIIEEVLKLEKISSELCDKPVIDSIYEEAEKISEENSSPHSLEDKIVLSIAIRLKAEQFIINKLGENVLKDINDYQTNRLITKYKEKFGYDSTEAVKLLNQVDLMTPENIHINSFMYEPILDMSHEHLIKLYNDIKNLS